MKLYYMCKILKNTSESFQKTPIHIINALDDILNTHLLKNNKIQ